MFETVKTDVFTRSAFVSQASRNGFSDDFDLDFGGVLGARSAHILLFGRPGDQGMHVFRK